MQARRRAGLEVSPGGLLQNGRPTSVKIRNRPAQPAVPWAERAAELGWNARALFGCHRNSPLMHLGTAGLLWVINGGKLLELHRDWAIIELPVNTIVYVAQDAELSPP